MTRGTAGRAWSLYLSSHRIDVIQREPEMTKFYSLIAACAVFVPVALSVMSQAAQMVA